jgi:hypothetical protein
MHLIVFTCAEGLLLSPECMLAPRAATERYSCVSSVIGMIDTRQLPPALRERVAREVQAEMFAFVDAAEVTSTGLAKLVQPSQTVSANNRLSLGGSVRG